MAGIVVRPGRCEDLETVQRIQAACPEAAQWNPADYLQYDFAVALWQDQVVGFIVARRLIAEESGGESEILNLAVDPRYRRQGIGRMLFDKIRVNHPGTIYLEVRESNGAARGFYEHLGFQSLSSRPGYYPTGESGIVLKFHSC